MKRLFRRRQYVGLCVLEAEQEFDVGLRDERLEGARDVLRACLMLTMNEAEAPLGVSQRGIQGSASIAGERPLLLGLEARLPHVLARGQADPAQQWICTKQRA